MKKIAKPLTTVFGVMMVAFAISVFYMPNRIVTGGLSGVATILYHLLHIPMGITTLGGNLILLLIAWKHLSKNFVIKTIYCSTLLSIFTELFVRIPPLTNDLLLASVFGGILYGLGIGGVMLQGGSTGGTDILSRLIQARCPHLRIGSVLLAVDAAIMFCSFLAFKTGDLIFYGIIALFLCTSSVNALIRKMNISKLALVVSRQGRDIAGLLVSHSPRGVTIVNSIGAYTMRSNYVLMCALKEKEIPAFQAEVLNIDQDAFIIYLEAQEIIGKGFRFYS